MYLICINQGRGCIVPEAEVNKNQLYYIEWVYQRSRLCHKYDVTTGCICKPGYKCDVNLLLNPYIVEVDLDQLNTCMMYLICINLSLRCYITPTLVTTITYIIFLHPTHITTNLYHWRSWPVYIVCRTKEPLEMPHLAVPHEYH